MSLYTFRSDAIYAKKTNKRKKRQSQFPEADPHWDEWVYEYMKGWIEGRMAEWMAVGRDG